jgi:hypothetical protein
VPGELQLPSLPAGGPLLMVPAVRVNPGDGDRINPPGSLRPVPYLMETRCRARSRIATPGDLVELIPL